MPPGVLDLRHVRSIDVPVDSIDHFDNVIRDVREGLAGRSNAVADHWYGLVHRLLDLALNFHELIHTLVHLVGDVRVYQQRDVVQDVSHRRVRQL